MEEQAGQSKNFRLDYVKVVKDHRTGATYAVTAEIKAVDRRSRAWVVVSGICKQEGKENYSRFDQFLPLLSMDLPVPQGSMGEKSVAHFFDRWTDSSLDLFAFASGNGGLSSVQWPQWLQVERRLDLKDKGQYFGFSATEAKKMRMQLTRESFERLRAETAKFHAEQLIASQAFQDLEELFAKTYVLLRGFGVQNLHSTTASILNVDASFFRVSDLSVLTGKLKRQGLIP